MKYFHVHVIYKWLNITLTVFVRKKKVTIHLGWLELSKSWGNFHYWVWTSLWYLKDDTRLQCVTGFQLIRGHRAHWVGRKVMQFNYKFKQFNICLILIHHAQSRLRSLKKDALGQTSCKTQLSITTHYGIKRLRALLASVFSNSKANRHYPSGQLETVTVVIYAFQSQRKSIWFKVVESFSVEVRFVYFACRSHWSKFKQLNHCSTWHFSMKTWSNYNSRAKNAEDIKTNIFFFSVQTYLFIYIMLITDYALLQKRKKVTLYIRWP